MKDNCIFKFNIPNVLEPFNNLLCFLRFCDFGSFVDLFYLVMLRFGISNNLEDELNWFTHQLPCNTRAYGLQIFSTQTSELRQNLPLLQARIFSSWCPG